MTMSTPSAAAARPDDVAPLAALERGVDQLAQLVRGDVEPAQFLRELLRLAVQCARADEAAVWLRSGEATWTLFRLDVAAPDGQPERRSNCPTPDWLPAALSAPGPQVARLPTPSEQGGAAPWQLAASIRQGGQPTGVLAWTYLSPALPLSTATLQTFAAALAELTGDFLVQHELRILRQERAETKLWEQFLAALHRCETLEQAAALLVQDGRALSGCERVTVVRVRGRRARVAAVSGADAIDPRSTTVRGLEQLALQALPQSAPAVWLTEDAATTSGAVAAGVLLLRDAGGACSGALVCERFTPPGDAARWRTQCETLQRCATATWTGLCEREDWPLARWQRAWKQAVRRWPVLSRRWAPWVAAAAAVVAALCLIPAEFTVTGEGRLLPDARRDIFATTSGVVQEVRVQHADEVEPGQTLAVLRDPQVELELTRVAGELATVRARYAVIQSARISASTGADPALRAQQLTAEEEELKQRLDSLTRQHELLQAERAQWELRSPIRGQVLTWDTEPLLAGRPVDRGQVLLTVGATAGDWVAEVRLRERSLDPVWRAWDSGRNRVAVEFIAASDPGRTCRGEIRRLAQVAELDARGESTVLAIVAFDRAQLAPLRPGATVTARVRCGRQPLGTVWFHELFHAVRRQWWLWW